jgi:hypothetical protein
MGAAIGPAAMQRPEHPLLVTDEDPHLDLTSMSLVSIFGPFKESPSVEIQMGGSPSAGTYKSRFTQNVNLTRLDDMQPDGTAKSSPWAI